MRFHADLHIHSKYSRACSRDCDLEHLTWWAKRKGITLVGTGDFTHPAWFDHLRENLVAAEPGLFRLRPELETDIVRTLPPSCSGDVRFMLSVEISTIYKRADATRKVHHLIYFPDFDSVATFNAKLGRIGNLGSDGRPILGLDSRDLLEIVLESSPDGYLVPAHVWTPWFAVLGSKSGFDRIEDCYVDLADHIFALETGLSSDPPMNWRISGLDRYRLVSNSDAHSPPMLGREASVFDTDLDYYAVRRALETGIGYAGSVEFFPEEGKYHVDGHRKCDVRMAPAESREHGGRCPVCGKPLTIGVLHRVEELADRAEGFRPEGAAGYRSLVPLPEIVGEIMSVGPKSKKVQGEIAALTAAFGPELAILEQVPPDDIATRSPLLAEAVTRLRRGEVIREAGYDGEYGVIRLFEPGELKRTAVVGAAGLFDEPESPKPEPAPRKAAPKPVVAAEEPEPEPEPEPSPVPDAESELLAGLDPEQRAAAEVPGGPLLIIAGPGTGKTRTLTHRIAHLVSDRGVAPEECLAITFTRRAAAEMAERLTGLIGERADRLTIATFHALGVRILREQHDRAGLSAGFGIADPARAIEVLAEITGDERSARATLERLSRHRRQRDEDEDPDLDTLLARYTEALRAADLVDFDDLVAVPVRLLESDPDLVTAYRNRYRWISVDEYQDVDETQYRLLRLLAPPDGNLTAIGDPDQAIYSFRGADVGFFLRFAEDFPSARTVRLSRNYRSTPPILTGAVQAIAPTTLVRDRDLVPAGEFAEPTPIGVHRAATEQAEASFVARTIDQLLGGSSFHSLDSGRAGGDGEHDIAMAEGIGFSDIAVLYRTDAQSRAIAEALTRSGVPFQKRSHDRLLDRPGVRDILRCLGYAGQDVPGDSVLAKVRAAAKAAIDLPAGDETEDRSVEIFFAVDLLTPLAQRCSDDIEQFLGELAFGAEVDAWDPRADRVSLLTLHAAKGLEFPVVFLVGCEDGLLPLRWPGAPAADEDVAEERRLFFVGMTRAQRHLYLSHAAERTRAGNATTPAPSPFLADLDQAVLRRIGGGTGQRRVSTQLRLL